MDPQAGYINDINKDSYYLKDINYDRSYICRLDNGEFNTNLFNKVNNEKTRPFTPRTDVPYMYKEGMISKDEYERGLKGIFD